METELSFSDGPGNNTRYWGARDSHRGREKSILLAHRSVEIFPGTRATSLHSSDGMVQNVVRVAQQRRMTWASWNASLSKKITLPF